MQDMKAALHNLIRFAQKCAFKDEFKALENNKEIPRSSKLQKLRPVMIDGLLCVVGRLENAGDDAVKHPVILANAHLAALLIRDAHERNGHVGSNYVMIQRRRKIPPVERAQRRQIGFEAAVCSARSTTTNPWSK